MPITEEYAKAIRKERDEWKKKYAELKKELDKTDASIGERLKEWIKINDIKELHETYPSLKWTITKMKQIVAGELHD